MDFETAWSTWVTVQQAERELKRHGFTLKQFQAECGEAKTYKGSIVLGWLGY